MRLCSRILLFQCFLIAQHVSSDISLITRSSKTVFAASGFYIRLWVPAAVKAEFLLNSESCRHQQTYVKPEATNTVVELLMMSGVLLETC